MNRRLAIAGLALVASLGLAGCGSNDTDKDGGTASSPTPAIAADPKQALADSVQAIAEGNFSFTIADHESTGEGSVHKATKSGQLVAKSLPGSETDFTMGFVIIGDDRWIKLEFKDPALAEVLKLPSGWSHLDSAKIKDQGQLKEMSIDFADPDDVDPVGAGLILKALLTAESTGEGSYSGTVDLTKAKEAGAVDEDVLAALKDKAKAIPFTATLDAQGRLTRLTLDMPAAGAYKAHKLDATYSDYGTAGAAKKPAGAKEAPDSTYELINS